jgi:outer membrane biosynthesis protein TonB
MRTTDLALRTLSCIFILVFAGCIPGHALLQTEQEKDNAASQEKKREEQKPEASTTGGIEILSDTMGVDFGPYMKRVRYAVKSHWNQLIPDVALPPLLKSGTVTIELAIMRQGQVVRYAA